MNKTPALSRTAVVREEAAGRVVIQADGEEAMVAVLVGYDGTPLPSRLSGPRLERLGPAAWRLSAAEGTFEFRARGVEVLEPRPTLFAALLSPFALKRRDRITVGVLLRMLRLPGGAWLLRHWHARRR